MAPSDGVPRHGLRGSLTGARHLPDYRWRR